MKQALWNAQVRVCDVLEYVDKPSRYTNVSHLEEFLTPLTHVARVP